MYSCVYDQRTHCIAFIHPNPLDPKRYVIVFAFNDAAAFAKGGYFGLTGANVWKFRSGDATIAGIQGDAVDANWGMRFDMEAAVGVRLPKRRGNLLLGFFQWDQNLDLYEKPGGNYLIGNTLSSPIPDALQSAFDEDLDNVGDVNGVDFRSLYITDGTGREISTEPAGNPLDPNVLDSAEDLNNNGRNDLFSFSQSDLLKGRMSVDVQYLCKRSIPCQSSEQDRWMAWLSSQRSSSGFGQKDIGREVSRFRFQV